MKKLILSRVGTNVCDMNGEVYFGWRKRINKFWSGS